MKSIFYCLLFIMPFNSFSQETESDSIIFSFPESDIIIKCNKSLFLKTYKTNREYSDDYFFNLFYDKLKISDTLTFKQKEDSNLISFPSTLNRSLKFLIQNQKTLFLYKSEEIELKKLKIKTYYTQYCSEKKYRKRKTTGSNWRKKYLVKYKSKVFFKLEERQNYNRGRGARECSIENATFFFYSVH